MTEERLIELWEGRTLYTTKKSIIREITVEEAVELYKQDIYFTEGIEMIMFDEDKTTCKEMLRYVFEKEPLDEKKSMLWLWILIFFIFIIILIIIVLSIGGSEKQVVKPQVKPLEQIIQPIKEEKQIPILDQNIEREKKGEELLEIKSSSIITKENQLLIIDKLNYEIETQRFYNEKLLDENTRLKSDYNIINTENTKLKSQVLNLENQNKKLLSQKNDLETSILGEKTNLEKYLGVKLFNLCKEKEGDLRCQQLFNQFYNQK